MIAGASSGSVIFRNVVNSFAPRSIAASSRWRSKPISRAFTVTTMKLTMNMTWAMKIVQKPSGKTLVMLRKSVRSEAPRTISGVAIGRKTRTFVDPRPRKSCRTIASAISVPRIGATSVASTPIWIDLIDGLAEPEHRVPVEPVVERELLPDVVEATCGLVEREEDDDGDRQHQVGDARGARTQ